MKKQNKSSQEKKDRAFLKRLRKTAALAIDYLLARRHLAQITVRVIEQTSLFDSFRVLIGLGLKVLQRLEKIICHRFDIMERSGKFLILELGTIA